MRYFLDTEFIECPCTIDLISIGIVREDGREYYAESSEVDWGTASPWVIENVKPFLTGPVRPRSQIAYEVLSFIGDDKPEFWGYYSDYDWVVFCWLFGAMVDLPSGFPMFCMDIKQLCVQLGDPKLPAQDVGEHHALADAHWNRLAHSFLTQREP